MCPYGSCLCVVMVSISAEEPLVAWRALMSPSMGILMITVTPWFIMTGTLEMLWGTWNFVLGGYWSIGRFLLVTGRFTNLLWSIFTSDRSIYKSTCRLTKWLTKWSIYKSTSRLTNWPVNWQGWSIIPHFECRGLKLILVADIVHAA